MNALQAHGIQLMPPCIQKHGVLTTGPLGRFSIDCIFRAVSEQNWVKAQRLPMYSLAPCLHSLLDHLPGGIFATIHEPTPIMSWSPEFTLGFTLYCTSYGSGRMCADVYPCIVSHRIVHCPKNPPPNSGPPTPFLEWCLPASLPTSHLGYLLLSPNSTNTRPNTCFLCKPIPLPLLIHHSQPAPKDGCLLCPLSTSVRPSSFALEFS